MKDIKRTMELARLWAIHEQNLMWAEIEEKKGDQEQAEYHQKRSEEYFNKFNSL